MLEIGSASLRNGASHFSRSRKTDYRDVAVARQRSAYGGAAAAYKVKHAARHTCLGEHLHQVVNRQRRVLGGLNHHGIPADQSGHDLPGRNRHREIPWSNHGAHANGLAHAHGKLVRQFRRRGLAKKPPPFARHVIRHVDSFLNVAARFREDLAHLAGHVLGKLFFAQQEKFCRAKQYLRALGRRDEPPGLVRFLRGIHGRIRVLRG